MNTVSDSRQELQVRSAKSPTHVKRDNDLVSIRLHDQVAAQCLLLAKLTERVVTTIRSRARVAELTIDGSLALRKGMNVSVFRVMPFQGDLYR
jgi:hypothetical protein